MKITPLDIRKQEFKKTIKGYDKHEVDIFLEMVAKELEDIVRENNALVEQVRGLDTKIEDYRRMEKTLQDTLTSAQKTTDDLRKNAEKEAKMMVKNAGMEAEKVMDNANKKVQDLLTQISALKNQKSAFISQLRGFLTSQLRLLDEVEKEGKEQIQKRVKEVSIPPDRLKKKEFTDIGELFKEKK